MGSPPVPEQDLLAVVRDLSFARDLDRVTAIVRVAARRLTDADGVTFAICRPSRSIA